MGHGSDVWGTTWQTLCKKYIEKILHNQVTKIQSKDNLQCFELFVSKLIATTGSGQVLFNYGESIIIMTDCKMSNSFKQEKSFLCHVYSKCQFGDLMLSYHTF